MQTSAIVRALPTTFASTSFPAVIIKHFVCHFAGNGYIFNELLCLVKTATAHIQSRKIQIVASCLRIIAETYIKNEQFGNAENVFSMLIIWRKLSLFAPLLPPTDSNHLQHKNLNEMNKYFLKPIELCPKNCPFF